jgi:hypothetical protein
MATNPISSESLTVNYQSLMKIPVGDRVKVARMSSFAEELMAALTPTQMALAFPDYYRRQLPDISNFILANRYLDSGGKFHQTGGGAQGSAYPYYDGPDGVNPNARPGGVPEPTVKEMKEKLLKKGIDVDKTYEAMKTGALLEGDDRVKFMKGMSDEELSKMGLQRIHDENGKTLIQMSAVSAETMTNEQLVSEMKKEAASKEGTYRPVYPLSDIDLSPEVINTIAGEALNNKESIDGVINNMLNRVGAEKNWGNLRDVARSPGQYEGYRNASDEQAEFIRSRIKEIASGKVPSNIGAATEFRAQYYVMGEGYGKTFEREARKQGYLQPGPNDNIYAETFPAGPYAPRKAEEVEKIKTENAAKINKSYTPEEIAEFKRLLMEKQQSEAKNKLIKELYNRPSMTSSDYIQAPFDNRETTIVPNQYTQDLPGGDSATRNKKDVRGIVFHKSPLSLEQLQKGEDARGSSYGYNTAIISSYVDASGNRLSEAEWKRLSDSEKQNYTEKAEVHQIRSEDVRPNQMKGSTSSARSNIGKELDNTNALGVVTIGSDSPAKQAAAQNYVADLLARGVITEEALSSTYGHGEVQPDEGRASLDPGKTPEGSYMAESIRNNVDEIKKKAEEIRKLSLGGNVYGLNEDLTLVETNTGNPVAQVNENEKLIKQGSMMQVTPETKIVAEQLSDNTSVNTTDAEEPQTSPEPTKLNKQVELPPQRETDNMWRESINATAYDPSPSYQRAMNKAKYQNTFLPDNSKN